MYTEIYIDMVFLINLVMDYLILWIVKVMTKRHVKKIRLGIAAVVGAVITCLIILIPYSNYFTNVIVGYLLTSLLLIYIAFRPRRISELIKLTIIMYLSAVMLGGIMFALYYYSSIGVTFSKVINSTYNMDLKIGLFIVFGVIAIVIIKLVSRIMTSTVLLNKNLFGVEIMINTQKISVNGLLDTGNNLYDPITKNPVIIAESNLLNELFKDDNLELLKSISENMYDLTEFAEIRLKTQLKLRLIPFASLGNDNGMLLGIVADHIRINLGDQTKDFYDVVIAMYNKKLSSDNSYQVLLHPELVKAL